jgi:hypothetical protein
MRRPGTGSNLDIVPNCEARMTVLPDEDAPLAPAAGRPD